MLVCHVSKATRDNECTPVQMYISETHQTT